MEEKLRCVFPVSNSVMMFKHVLSSISACNDNISLKKYSIMQLKKIGNQPKEEMQGLMH